MWRCATSGSSSPPSPWPGSRCATRRAAPPGTGRDRDRARDGGHAREPAPRTPRRAGDRDGGPPRRRGGGDRAAPGAGQGPDVAAPGRDAATGGPLVRRAAGRPAVRPHELPQRRGLRRAGHRPGHPAAVAVRAPPAALLGGRAHRLPAGRPDPRPVQSRPGARALRPRPAGPGAADPAGGRLAAGAPGSAGGRCGRRGRAPVHVAARRPGHRGAHRDLRAARGPALRRALPCRVLRAHRNHLTPPREEDPVPTQAPFVVVGAGLAGAKAAETLREEGFDGPVVLVGAEPERPYERPALSKQYLLGSAGRDSVFVHEPGWYADHDVELRTGVRATRLDPAAHRLELDTGEELGYARLLLATGASARRLPVPGADLDGVRYLRTFADSDTLLTDLSGGGRNVVIVGAGWIGLEVAAAARHHGNAVTVVEPQPTPLHAVLGAEMGQVFARLHRAHDVDLFTGTTVREFGGRGDGVPAVVTDGHAGLPADVVVVGVGAIPNTDLAAAAGLEVDNGIVTDHALRTSAPDVFAAGDVTSAF